MSLRRSRNGCVGCKQRKLKCDEQKPKCGACKKKSIECEYKKQLNWLGSVAKVTAPSEVTRYKNKPPRPLDCLPSPPSPPNREISPPSTPGIPFIFPTNQLRSLNTLTVTDLAYLAPESPWNGTQLTQLPDMPLAEHFHFYVNVTAAKLVPVPYSDNPFLTLLPRLAMRSKPLYQLLVAYGAAHQDMLIHPGRAKSNELVDRIVFNVAQSIEAMLLVNPDSEMALMLAAVLSSLEVDRNSPNWRQYAQLVLDTMDRNSLNFAGPLDELQSFVMRLIAFMEVVGSLSIKTFSQLPEATWWPRWAGAIDYLTGIDLNFLPLFAEVANLVQLRESTELSRRELSRVHSRGLQIFQLLSDYWMEENQPVNEISAMCILYQQALQVHIYRRLLRFPMQHCYVQRLVERMTHLFDRFIPNDAPIQFNMSFIIVTAASEVIDPGKRRSYLRRLKTIEQAGFAYVASISAIIEDCWRRNQSFIRSGRMNLLM